MANKNKNPDKLVASIDTDSTSEFEVKRLLRAMRDDGPEIEVDEQTFDIDDHQAGLNSYSRAELRALLTERETELENLRYQYEQINSKHRGLDEELKARVEITDDLNAKSAHAEERISELIGKLDVEVNDRNALRNDLDRSTARTEDLEAQLLSAAKNLDEASRNLDAEVRDRQSLQQRLDDAVKNTEHLKTQSNSAETRLEEAEQKILSEAEDRKNLEQKLDAGINEQNDLRSDLDKSIVRAEDLEAQLRSVEEDLEEASRKYEAEATDRQSLQQRLDDAVKNTEHLKTQSISAETRLEEAEQKISAEEQDRKNLEQKLEAEVGERDILAQKLEAEVKDRKSLQQRLDESARQAEHLKTESQSAEARLDETLRSLESETKDRSDLAQKLASETSERDSLAKKLDTEIRERQVLQQQFDKSVKNAERLKEKSDGLVAASKDLKGKLRTLEGDTAKKDKKVASLEKRNKKLTDQKRSVNKIEIEKAKKVLSDDLHVARNEVAELKSYIDARKREWAGLTTNLQDKTQQLVGKKSEVESLSAELDARNAQLVRSREQCIAASEDLANQKSRVRKLRKQNRELEKALHHDAKQELDSSRKVATEQAGKLDAQSHRLEELKGDLEKSASYADTLRMQLQDQISVSKVSVAMRENLEAGLDAANAAINELTGKHQAELERADELVEQYESLQAKFDNEIRQIRFELGTAEETIAGQETMNEQLVSDLVDHRSFRQALESQLGEVEQESSDSVAELNRELKKIRRDADDLERNLRNKDSVITELMQELSDRSDSIELKDESGNGLQKIDGFKSETDEEQSLGERVARQLIGNADGQELRFPLFKDRLTIGRTSNNDIQLNMQYISRRHAVISIDHNQTRVIDWGSKNGVFVNDTKVTERILKSGDIVTIGTTDFRYEERSKR